MTFTDEVIKESVARVRKLIQEAEGKGKPMGTEKSLAKMIEEAEGMFDDEAVALNQAMEAEREA